MQVKSFEETSIGSCGDLLSGGRIKRKLKTGLLTCGYFEYWRMFPEKLRQNVASDLETVGKRIAADFGNVVYSGLVDTIDSADRAGQRFLSERVDALIVVEGTYTPDFITLHAINYVSKIPVLFFSVQLQEIINQNGNYENSLRNSGLIGITQITGTFRKLNRDYEVVVGSVHDDEAYSKIACWMRAQQAILDVKECNIGVIGHVFRGMYDLELSKTFFKSTFDSNIINIQDSHLVDLWQEVSEDEATHMQKRLTGRFAIRGIDDEDVFYACRLAIALRRLVERFNVDALCFLDQHYIQRMTRTSARIGASLLMEEKGIVAASEGDIGGILMMLLMRSINGKSPLMGEWGEYDAEHNICLIMGHGIGTPDMASSDQDVILTKTPEEWGFEGAGLNYELKMRPGRATIGHIMETGSGYRMLISPCESIVFPSLRYDELYATLRFHQPVKQYLEKILEKGVSHHCIVGIGDFAQEMIHIAKHWKLEILYEE